MFLHNSKGHIFQCEIVKKLYGALTVKFVLLHTSKIRNLKCEKNESVWGAVEFSFFQFSKRLIFQCGTKKLSSSYLKYFLTQNWKKKALEGAVSGTYVSSFIWRKTPNYQKSLPKALTVSIFLLHLNFKCEFK